MANTQYAVKIRMKSTGSYSVGPFNLMDEARTVAEEIVSGEMESIKTQRGSIIFLCDDPEVVEVVPFTRRDREDDQ
jgi:hypothetical protein